MTVSGGRRREGQEGASQRCCMCRKPCGGDQRGHRTRPRLLREVCDLRVLKHTETGVVAGGTGEILEHMRRTGAQVRRLDVTVSQHPEPEPRAVLPSRGALEESS